MSETVSVQRLQRANGEIAFGCRLLHTNLASASIITSSSCPPYPYSAGNNWKIILPVLMSLQ